MLYIGIDDTDSSRGMCTTYIGAVLKERLSRIGTVEELRLVRLNPNVKYKTRGNASVGIVVNTPRVKEAKKIVIKTVEEFAVFDDPKTNPGIVFYQGNPEVFRGFYYRTLHKVVDIEEAEALAQRYNAEVVKYKLGRGIVGALAAIGADLRNCTYEAIAYRTREMWGKPRKISYESVVRMNELTFPLTFNNLDEAEERMLIAPHTPCPVLFGVRGLSEEVVREAARMVKPLERVERIAVFRTNQGTDAHLERVNSISEIVPYSSVILRGKVCTRPRVIAGGHVFFEITDGKERLRCAAFEPTKDFRKVVLELIPGDEVEVYGGVVPKKGVLTLNLEKLRVIRLVTHVEANPRCEKCGRRMESAGRNQGFRCRVCKTKAYSKVLEPINRRIEERLYTAPPIAMRHLSRPAYLPELVEGSCT